VRSFSMGPALLLATTLVVGCGGEPCDGSPELCLLAEETAEAFLCVRAPGDDDVWMVGTEAVLGVSGPSALHWNGVDWERLDLSDFSGRELWWVHPGERTTTMVGSAGLILEYDRSSGVVSRIDGPDSAITFFGVWGASDDDLWAVGGDISGGLPGQIWRRDASGWAPYEGAIDAPPNTIWFKVDGRASDDLWIVGSGGQTLRWDGSELTAHSAAAVSSGASLFTVDVSSDEVIAVGGSAEGVILHYAEEDEAWVDQAPEYSSGINGICSGSELTRAVGGQGAVYSLEDGTWSYELVGLTLRDYHACAISPSGELWTVGGQIVSRPLTAGVVAYAGAQSVPPVPGW
jgi:hypothetical protein